MTSSTTLAACGSGCSMIPVGICRPTSAQEPAFRGDALRNGDCPAGRNPAGQSETYWAMLGLVRGAVDVDVDGACLCGGERLANRVGAGPSADAVDRALRQQR